MTTMMEHPKHGRHPAVGSEIESMKENGWTVRAPKVSDAPTDNIKHQGDEHIALIKTAITHTFPPAPAQVDQLRIKRPYNRKA